jgi:hypothetical protein
LRPIGRGKLSLGRNRRSGVEYTQGFVGSVERAHLACALGQTRQRDVHDADVAQQQAHCGHGPQPRGPDLCRARQGVRDLPRAEDVEFVVFVLRRLSRSRGSWLAFMLSSTSTSTRATGSVA